MRRDFVLGGARPPAASSNPYETANLTGPASSTDEAFAIPEQGGGSGDISMSPGPFVTAARRRARLRRRAAGRRDSSPGLIRPSRAFGA
jgi:hypothetical protein